MSTFPPYNKSAKPGVKACKMFNHCEVAVTSGQLVFPGSRDLGSKVLAFGSPGHSLPEGNLPPALFPGDPPPALLAGLQFLRGNRWLFQLENSSPQHAGSRKATGPRKGRSLPSCAWTTSGELSARLCPGLGAWGGRVDRGRPALPGASPSELPPSCKLSFATFKKTF